MDRSGCKVWTLAEALKLGRQMGVDWGRIDACELVRGMTMEAEHGSCDPSTDITRDDPVVIAKIAIAHLNEFPAYYSTLEAIGREGRLKRRTP